MKKLICLSLTMFGCSLQWKNTRPLDALPLEQQQAACTALDAKQMAWGAVVIAAGALSGASGITSIALPDNQAVVYAMGGVSVGVAAIGAVATFLQTSYTQRFCRQCANVVPPAETKR